MKEDITEKKRRENRINIYKSMKEALQLIDDVEKTTHSDTEWAAALPTYYMSCMISP
jgi:hypothetical protein